MNDNLKRQIAELRKLSVTQLRQRHLELFGEPNESGHREYLYRRIAWRLQARAEGHGLSAQAPQRAAALARDSEVRTTMPPEFRQHLADPHPRPGHAVRRGTLRLTLDKRLPIPGQRLTRKFKGTTYEVTVLPGGFQMDGQIYPSLSAVAKAITGSHWNGYHFFNLMAAPRDRHSDQPKGDKR